VPVNLCKGSLGVQVFRGDSVIYRFKLQVFGGSRGGGEFLLESLPSIRGVLIFIIGMDESRVDGHGESAEALVVGFMSGVNPQLVGDLASVIALSGGFINGDGPPCTNSAEVASDEWGPLEVVGAFKSGDTTDERGRGGGHCEKGRFWNKRHQ